MMYLWPKLTILFADERGPGSEVDLQIAS